MSYQYKYVGGAFDGGFLTFQNPLEDGHIHSMSLFGVTVEYEKKGEDLIYIDTATKYLREKLSALEKIKREPTV